MFDIKFDWCPEMSTGYSKIDKQHQELFRIGREIEQLVQHNCIGVSKRQLLDIVCELRNYVAYHFYFEEELMEKYGYEEFEYHREMHNDFKKKIVHIDNRELGENPQKVLSELKITLQNWLFDHILKEDTKMCHTLLPKLGEEDR